MSLKFFVTDAILDDPRVVRAHDGNFLEGWRLFGKPGANRLYIEVGGFNSAVPGAVADHAIFCEFRKRMIESFDRCPGEFRYPGKDGDVNGRLKMICGGMGIPAHIDLDEITVWGPSLRDVKVLAAMLISRDGAVREYQVK